MTPEEAIYLRWYYSTLLAKDPYPDRIARAVQDFRGMYEAGELDWINRIMEPTIAYFHRENGCLSRWPQVFLRLFNRPASTPFFAFAQPRYLERRKQGVAVWYTLLYFLTFLWHKHESDRGLEEVGFRPNRELQDLLDDMALYATLTHPRKPRAKAMQEKVVGFFWTAIRDPAPTVQTNPILWWLAALIGSEVEGRLAIELRLPVPEMVDLLTFTEKLGAIDHYARVVLVREEFGQWIRSGQWFEEDKSAWKREVIHWLDRRDVSWIDRDADGPPDAFLACEGDIERSEAWDDLAKMLEAVVQDWLDPGTRGPMREVHALRRGEVPATRTLPPPILAPMRRQYRVQLSIVEQWTFDPITAVRYPAQIGVYGQVEQANRTARRVIQNECGSKEDAVVWGESVGSCGEVRVRAVFIDAANNTKLVAWVEVEEEGASRDVEP